jgi:hypothetical protein
MGEIVAAAAGDYLGVKLGDTLGGGNNSGPQPPDVQAIVNKSNGILKQALQSALSYSQNYTNQAIGQQNTSLGASTSALNNSLSGATNAAQSSIQNALQQSQAINAPIVQTGYGALDRLQDSLGIARPAMGNAAYAADLQQAGGLQQQIGQLQQAAQKYGVSNPYAVPTAPTAPTAPQANTVNSQQAQQAIQQFMQSYSQGGSSPQQAFAARMAPNPGLANMGGLYQPGLNYQNMNDPNVIAAVQQAMQQRQTQAAQQQYQSQLPAYQSQLANYNGYNNIYQNLQNQLNTNPQAAQMGIAAQQGLFGTPQVI